LHGVSGHLYELIDYWYICYSSGISSAILLSDGTTKETFFRAVTDKYNFTDSELKHMDSVTTECHKPLVIICKNMCIVDGASLLNGSTVYADNVFLFRCSDNNFAYFSGHKSIKRTHLMQDFDLYPERYEELDIKVINYNKKILWQKYKQPNLTSTNTALFYLTTNCRALPPEEIQSLIDKHKFEKYLIVTNNPSVYTALCSDSIRVEQAPVKNIFEQFDTYVYTATPKRADCSPRFIVECAVYNKQVVYEIDYVDLGIECRKRDMNRDLNSLMLTSNDFFVQYFKDILNERQH
jgi:hypothetical protein